MNIYTGLLFNQGHLHDPALVRSLAAEAPAPDAGSPSGQDARPRGGAAASTRNVAHARATAPSRHHARLRLAPLPRVRGWTVLLGDDPLLGGAR